jgi:hypothetical protein
MIYTININQKALMGNGWNLPIECAILLDACLSMAKVTAFQKSSIRDDEGNVYFWLDYAKIAVELPLFFVGKTNTHDAQKKVLRRMFTDLEGAGYILKHKDCQRLTRNYIAFTELCDTLTYTKNGTALYQEWYSPIPRMVHNNNTNYNTKIEEVVNDEFFENPKLVTNPNFDLKSKKPLPITGGAARHGLDDSPISIATENTHYAIDDNRAELRAQIAANRQTELKPLQSVMTAERFADLATDTGNIYAVHFARCSANFDYTALYNAVLLWATAKQKTFANEASIMTLAITFCAEQKDREKYTAKPTTNKPLTLSNY